MTFGDRLSANIQLKIRHSWPPPDPGHRVADDAGDASRHFADVFIGKVDVTLGGTGIGMTEQTTHGVETAASISRRAPRPHKLRERVRNLGWRRQRNHSIVAHVRWALSRQRGRPRHFEARPR